MNSVRPLEKGVGINANDQLMVTLIVAKSDCIEDRVKITELLT